MRNYLHSSLLLYSEMSNNINKKLCNRGGTTIYIEFHNYSNKVSKTIFFIVMFMTVSKKNKQFWNVKKEICQKKLSNRSKLVLNNRLLTTRWFVAKELFCVEYVCAETHNYCSFLDTIIVLLAAGKVRMNDDYVYAFNVVHPYYYSSTRLRLLLEW